MVVKNLFGEEKKLPSIFYGRDTFKFYTENKNVLENWVEKCEEIIRMRKKDDEKDGVVKTFLVLKFQFKLIF